MSNYLEFLILGGPVTWIILLLALFAIYFIILKAFHLHRAQIDVREFLRGVTNILQRHNVYEAISICDDTPGPVAHVIRAAITRCDKSKEDMEQGVEETCLSEIPRLQRNLKPLVAIAHMAPLLGLLGTVMGMIDLFQTMESAGSFIETTDMAKGIWQALLSTGLGLTVAIPTYGFYVYFLSKIDHILLDMEKAASEIIYFLGEHDLKLENADAETEAIPDQSQDHANGTHSTLS